MPVAIVTGASRGFGRALALDLAKDHWSLVIDGRRARELDEIKETLKRLSANVSAIVGDVTDPNHRAALIESAESFGGLDLLVNNASTLGPSPLPERTPTGSRQYLGLGGAKHPDPLVGRFALADGTWRPSQRTSTVNLTESNCGSLLAGRPR
jgi:NAD(P)-dependent dehydrogenase (short-subunit alcohol dehydrogenase family)